MNEAASSSSPRPTSGSPPPKCAICLGTCTNKCFSNSCMHQFCFTCLLEWSKVKPECPLCKQPFKSIIHNIKSNEEYDEYIVEEPRGIFNNEEGFLYLPPTPSRHFQFRTTFTVDPGGELAIQQMLLSHPLTNTLYNVPGNYVLPRSRFGRLHHPRRASSAPSFRRSIYMLNMWVYAPPDVTGRYRDVSPSFYRENPAARNRLVPWLNRELNALLCENTQQVMNLVDIIMDHLTRWHIRSRSFKNLLTQHLGTKTEHFIHEFYNFMRSPYDMIGYDRHIVYTDRPFSPTLSISDQDEDSDVAIVNISEPVGANNNPFRRPTIEVIEINSDSSHDSDVIIRETPAPEVVLIDSDSTSEVRRSRTPQAASNHQTSDSEESEVNRKPVLPLKIRLKRRRQTREMRSRNKKYNTKRYRSSSSSSSSSSLSSSSSSSSDDSSSSSSESSYKRRKTSKKHKYKKAKRSRKDSKSHHKEKSKNRPRTSVVSSSGDISSDESTATVPKSIGFDSDDNIPLSKIKSKEKKKKARRSNQNAFVASARSHTITSKHSSTAEVENVPESSNPKVEDPRPSCSNWKSSEVHNSTHQQAVGPVLSPVNLSLPINTLPSMSNNEYSFPAPIAHFKYEPYPLHVNNSHNGCLPDFNDNTSHYNNFQQYAQYPNSSYNSATIGNRYYEGPDYNLPRNADSYTPPLTHNISIENSSNTYGNSLHRNDYRYSYNCGPSVYQQHMQIPSRVTVGVGTSPNENETNERENNLFVAAGPSSTRVRLQSVIVKKEERKNANTFCGYVANSDSSDGET